MLCRNCDRETLAGASFCTHCGNPLRHSCPSCEASNPQESAFCYACGESLMAEASQGPEAPVRPPEAYWIEEAYKDGDPFGVEEPTRPGEEPTRPGDATQVERGGFWNRFVGVLIDGLILIVPFMLVSRFASDGGDFLLGMAYFVGFWAIWGATPGKRLLGLSIERPDGSRIGPGRAVARYFAWLLSFLLFGVGFIMAGLREDKRGLHDLICDTVVVQREPVSLSEMVGELWSSVRGVAR